MIEYLPVGKLGKPHGIKGELKIWVEEAFEEHLDGCEVLFLFQLKQYKPYFVSYVRGGGAAICKFEEINTPEAARLLSGLEIFLPAKDLPAPAPPPLDSFDRLLGYQIIDKDLGPLGIIEAIESYPQQTLASLSYQNRTVLIPLNEYFIQQTDHSNRTVIVQLPEGLLSL